MFSIFHFRLKVPLKKKIGADTLAYSFRMYYYCTKISNMSIVFAWREEWTHTNKKIPEKDRGVVCRGNNIPSQLFFFFIPFVILAPLSRSLPAVTQIRGHIASPPPSPLRHVPSFLSREEVGIFFPRRLASNCTYPSVGRSQQLIPIFVQFCRFSQISSWWESNSRTNKR